MSRLFLRHLASEENRFYFTVWEWAQLVLGGVFLLVLRLGSGGSHTTMGLALAMLAIVAVFRFFLTPEIIELGRQLDFQAPALPSDERSRFWDFHRAYSVMEVIKWLLGMILLAKFILQRRRSAGVSENLDVIEKTHYRHINR
jgi:hypothetical protein